MTIVPIVEGHGDFAAVPVLLRRLAIGVATPIDVIRPIRIPRGKMVKERELGRAVKLAAMHATIEGAIVVILDADEDCPARLAPSLLASACSERSDMRISVVIAKREFESWFVAAAESLVANGKLRIGAIAPDEPEDVVDAKGWLGRHMGRRYSETIDQPSFAALFDIEAARKCSSFDKLVRDFRSLSMPK